MTPREANGVYVIAEAGVNHNGSSDLARRLVDAAAAAGADAVKFQTFRATSLAAASAPKATYQKATTGVTETQLEMLQRLELSESMHFELAAHARDRGVEFLSTPFDELSLDLLTDRMGLRTIKVPSGEITNGPLLLAVARRADRVILSTGMSTLGEVEDALRVLSFGFVAGVDIPPGRLAFERAYASPDGRASLARRVTLLHCTSEYPAPVDDVNLRAMETLRSAFGLPVGYSDHTVGIHIAIAAAAMGATIIEKHFTLDRSLPGPDHVASLEPAELTQMVACIRDVARARGDGRKLAMSSELDTRTVARKSLVAARAVAAGERWTQENLTAKRPGDGVSPMEYWARLGTNADRALGPDERLT